MKRFPNRPARLRRLVYIVALAGCGGGAAEAIPAGGPPSAAATAARRYIVGVDVSSSQSPTRREEARTLVNGLIDQLSYGDELTLVETYRARSDAAGQWTTNAPAARNPVAPTSNDKRHLAQFRERVRTTAGAFFAPDPAHPVSSTDLLAMLGRAGDYARGGTRPTTLLVVSDMLNSTPELNMERPGGIPNARWIAARKAEGTLPDLRGVCVVVAGADVASKRGAQVREFWRQFFTAAGASFDVARYRTMIADAADVGCP